MDQVRTAEERSIREACDKVVRGRSKELEVVTVDGKCVLEVNSSQSGNSSRRRPSVAEGPIIAGGTRCLSRRQVS